MKPNQKLYVVIRRDLSPGSQAVQGMHALVEFSVEHRDAYFAWYRESNHLCMLSVENEKELDYLVGKLFHEGIKHSMFREPFWDMSLTAIAIEATDQASEAVKHLPLALKNVAPVGQWPFSRL